MRTRAVLAAVLLATSLGLTTGPADAAQVFPITGFASSTSGIARGADGNYWVAETTGSVARMSPSGAVLGRYPVGGSPRSVAAGPGGTIWVTVTNADQLAVFDTAVAAPTARVIATPSTCAPVGIVDGGDGRMYFSLPADGSPGCTDPAGISSVPAVGGTPATPVSGVGSVFDLAVSGGKLWAPDFEGDVVRRLTLAATPVPEATLTAPTGSNPDGITVDRDGRLWVSAYSTGQVLRFLPTATTPTVITPPGEPLRSALGIAATADGSVYLAGSDSHQVLRVSADGATFTRYDTPVDAEPLQVAEGPDGDVLVTDKRSARVLRLVDTAPRASATSANVKAAKPTVSASVDPRGNDTQVVFDYGTTTKYGETTAATTLAKSVGATTVTQALKGLQAGTTYHVRVRATNALGVTTSADLTFKAPTRPGDALLKTKTASGGRTAIKTLAVAGLKKGDTVSLRCQGKGCTPQASTAKPLKATKAGSLSLAKLVKGLVLSPGAKLTITVKLGKKTSRTVYTMVKGKQPQHTSR